jgi:FlaA1/EpsC-like NDP-sugar epimerase
MGHRVEERAQKRKAKERGFSLSAQTRPCQTARRLFLDEHAMSRILVTGAAGFIGAHLAAALARDGHAVIGFAPGPRGG